MNNYATKGLCNYSLELYILMLFNLHQIPPKYRRRKSFFFFFIFFHATCFTFRETMVYSTIIYSYYQLHWRCSQPFTLSVDSLLRHVLQVLLQLIHSQACNDFQEGAGDKNCCEYVSSKLQSHCDFHSIM